MTGLKHGSHDFSIASLRLPEKTVSQLPSAASSTGLEYIVTDAASATSVGAGGGSTVVLVRSNGSSWQIIGGGSSALADPGGNGIVKRTALNTTAAAVAGTDFYAPGGAIAAGDFPAVGSATHPAIISTLPFTTSFAIVGTSATIRFVKMVIPYRITVQRFQYWIHALGASGSKLGFALYASDLSLVVQSGAQAADSGATSAKSVSVTPVALVPGVYFVAWAVSDPTITVGGALTESTVAPAIFNLASPAVTPTYGTATGAFSTSTGMPSSISALTGLASGNHAVMAIVGFGQ